MPGSDAGGAPAETALARVLGQLNSNNKETVRDVGDSRAEEVEELAFYGIAAEAIAILLECNPSVLTTQFAAAMAHGRARQQQFILQKLAERVDLGEWPALKFALVNICGMADNPTQAALHRQKLAQLQAAISDPSSASDQEAELEPRTTNIKDEASEPGPLAPSTVQAPRLRASCPGQRPAARRP